MKDAMIAGMRSWQPQFFKSLADERRPTESAGTLVGQRGNLAEGQNGLGQPGPLLAPRKSTQTRGQYRLVLTTYCEEMENL